MIIRLIRWLRGYVDFCAYGKFPERFVNLTVKYGINLWNSRPIQGGMCGTMSLYDYKNIRKLCRKAKIRTKISKRCGLPFAVKKYSPRIGIPIGAVAGAIILFVLSNFIWTMSITSSENVSAVYIADVLEEKGVYVGAAINSVDVQGIERSMLLDIDELGWMSINITGCAAEINFKEKAPKPQTESKTPCNIKANADGVITDIKTSKGVTQVVKGSGVTKGELLVSGVLETKVNTLEYVHASAEIYADVISEKEIYIPSSFNYYSKSKNKTNRYICRFLCIEFPCSLSFNTFDNEITAYSYDSLFLNDTVLPLQIKTQSKNEVVCRKASLSEEQARQTALEKAILYEAFSKPDSSLVKRDIDIIKDDEAYTAKINYIFNENIAVTSEFSVTD